jgi:transposase
MSPRRRGSIPDAERERLLAALGGTRAADDELRAAVLAARGADGSVREIAALIGKSTNTIQRWTRDSNTAGELSTAPAERHDRKGRRPGAVETNRRRQ